MDNKSIIPFNLEAFKAGQKALTRDGRVATFVGICKECHSRSRLCVHIQGCGHLYTYFESGIYPDETQLSPRDLVSMVSRHQSLIDSYDPEDTWQASSQHGEWETIVAGEPMWFESSEYRIHPHNDLIKAQRNGAIIEKWVEAYHPTWFTCYGAPICDEDATYRVMPEEHKTKAFMKGYANTLKILNKRACKAKPTTKTIYEWMVRGEFGYWHLNGLLLTEDEAAKEFAEYEYKKTGRDWEVEV